MCGKWRVMKGIVSVIVVGSGFDWVWDECLCELVFDIDDWGGLVLRGIW